MKTIRSWAPSVLVSLLLVACGGSDPTVPGSGSPAGAPTTKGAFTAVVSFGDSLSDVGAYAPATSLTGNGAAPYFGGKFTTNSATGTVWVENIATSLGLLVTPAEVGYNGQSVKCPVAAVNAALAGTCTGYGQGGSRVTDPNGIGRNPATGAGALTVPVKTQIANHLARFTSFKASDLILVLGGDNDALVQFSAFAATAAQAQADAAAGKITADQANLALFQAQTAAQGEMKKGAFELAGYVNTEILAKGGKYVVVVSGVDLALTPFGGSVPATAKPVLAGLIEVFNLWLREALTGQPVLLIDSNAVFNELLKSPATFGFANTTVPACDPAKIQVITGGVVTNGSSLACNSTVGAPYYGLLTGADATTWLFADGVHPTTGGHKAFSDAVSKQLKAAGWI